MLGFEYGYSARRAECADASEANSAISPTAPRCCLDQFISSASASLRMFGLVCLLAARLRTGRHPSSPSARLERFPGDVRRGQMQVANARRRRTTSSTSCAAS